MGALRRDSVNGDLRQLLLKPGYEPGFLEQVLDSVPAGVAVLRGPEHRYVRVNPAYRQLSRGKGEVVGRTVAEVWPELSESICPILDRVYQTAEPYEAVDAPVHLERGRGTEEARFTCSYTPLRDRGGQVDGILVHAQETTEQVLTRGREKDLAAQLAQEWVVSERKALERPQHEFIALVSHELRNPLTAIKILAQHLQHHQAYSEQAVSTIVAQAAQVNRLIGDLLDVSSLDAGRLTLDRVRLDLPELVRTTTEQAQLLSPKHRLRMETSGQSRKGSWDRARLEQVLQNLLANASKYAPRGGEIVVRVEHLASVARVSVKDQGRGIPKQALPRLFERFYRVRSTGGYGRGLYITRALVVAHGGSVGVESEPGKGSTFTLSLPYEQPDDQGAEMVDLTVRQQEVAALIAQGLTNERIAENLVLTKGTVANHVEHILNRLGLCNRAQIAAWAVEHGLQHSDPSASER